MQPCLFLFRSQNQPEFLSVRQICKDVDLVYPIIMMIFRRILITHFHLSI